jgi:hypothetical protein
MVPAAHVEGLQLPDYYQKVSDPFLKKLINARHALSAMPSSSRHACSGVQRPAPMGARAPENTDGGLHYSITNRIAAERRQASGATHARYGPTLTYISNGAFAGRLPEHPAPATVSNQQRDQRQLVARRLPSRRCSSSRLRRTG